MIKIVDSFRMDEVGKADLVLMTKLVADDSVTQEVRVVKTRTKLPPKSFIIVTPDVPQFSDALKKALRKVYADYLIGAKDADNSVLYAEQQAQEARGNRERCKAVVQEIEALLPAEDLRTPATS